MLQPKLPDYDIDEWEARPFPERLEWVCRSWAADGYGSPLSVYAVYAAKIAFHVAMWALFCTFSGLPLADIGQWWAEPVAFQKMMLWTMLFEGLGLGCGSGPLTARYVPPIGGALHFLRPGTTKLPLIPGLGHRRTWLDVGLYGAVIFFLVAALTSAEIGPSHLIPLIVLVPLLGLLDKTLFLVFRSEHYLSMAIVFLFATDWIAGSKFVWMAIWWWAATSKLNHHFPAVMTVMNSNAPWTRFIPGMRTSLYRDFPRDLRPNDRAAALAHFGTGLEYAIPLLLLLSGGGPVTVFGLAVITVFHLFILSNVPMGVPLEWNVVMIYGAFVLFGVHADVGILSIGSPMLWAWLVGFHVLLPIYGSLFPRQVSFLLAMRYYAGNWAYNVWLFEKGADDKLERLVKISPPVKQQLGMLYDDKTVRALMSKVIAFRLMHLLGRALRKLVPMAVDDIDRYDWYDGEIVTGLALGWNFGDGHLGNEELLAAIQEQCGFEEGELRVISVESQPIHQQTFQWWIRDAKTGLLAEGTGTIDELREGQPWRVGSIPLAD